MASPFSGSAGRRAGMWAIGQANENAQRVSDLINLGQGNALGAIDAGVQPSLDALGQGVAQGREDYQGAIDRYNPWVSAGTTALGTYSNSLGLGGADGNAAATAAFREAPGYRYSVDQATDAVARKASSLGALGSGNTMQAISDRAQNMADQGYQTWQGQLKGLSDTGLTAVGQQANLQRGMGDLSAQQGRDEAGIYTNAASKRAGIYGDFTGLGVGNLTNLGNTVIEAGTGAMLAGQNAAQNRLNFGNNLLSLGSSLLGSYLGGKKAA